MMTRIVVMDEIKVMAVATEGGPVGAEKAFTKFESYLPTLRGRKFYGLISDEGRTYLAAVALTAEDQPESWGLTVASIPAGEYAQVKIKNWEKNLNQISPVFQSLSNEYKEDRSRPRIEFYRSQKELILRLPIL